MVGAFLRKLIHPEDFPGFLRHTNSQTVNLGHSSVKVPRATGSQQPEGVSTHSAPPPQASTAATATSTVSAAGASGWEGAPSMPPPPPAPTLPGGGVSSSENSSSGGNEGGDSCRENFGLMLDYQMVLRCMDTEAKPFHCLFRGRVGVKPHPLDLSVIYNFLPLPESDYFSQSLASKVKASPYTKKDFYSSSTHKVGGWWKGIRENTHFGVSCSQGPLQLHHQM
jgi:hypothetical protein